MTIINLNKLNKLISEYPEITSGSGSGSEVEVVDARMEAVTTGARDVKSNTVISIPSEFGGELFLATYANVVMSVITRDCK